MKKTYILIICIICLLNLSCADGDDSRILTDPTYLGEGFKGITFTTGSGEYWHNGTVDPSDWCEMNMEGEPTPDGMGFYYQFKFGPAGPNPTDGYGTIRASYPKKMHVKIFIINYKYEVMTVVADREAGPGNYSYQFNGSEWPGGVYRAVIEADDIKCTGDIWIYRLE